MVHFDQDVRYALRSLRKRPGFAFVVIAALALAIGANTAIFSAVNSLLLRPLPFQNPGGLVAVGETLSAFANGPIPFSAPDYMAFVARSSSFERLGIYGNHHYELSGLDSPQRLTGARISASLWPTLGVTPQLGRWFTEDEDKGSKRVVLLSYGFWRSKFGGDVRILGRSIILDRASYTVVGVMPRNFVFPPRGPAYNNEPAEVYVPISFTKHELEDWGSMYNNSVIGRLRAGVTLPQAQAESQGVMKRVAQLFPPELTSSGFRVGADLEPLSESITGRVRPILLVLMAAVGLVLLIGCADVASLMLTRAAARQREMSIRAALGASRLSLVMQVLIESLLLALVGGGLGLIVAVWTTALIVKIAPDNVPLVETIHIDGAVLAFTLFLSIFTALLFGLFPALEASRVDVNDGLREGGRGQTYGRGRAQVLNALVIAQFAFAIVLLVGAGLLVRSFSALLGTSPGFRADHVLSASVTLPPSSYQKGTEIRSFFDRLQAKLGELPGVKAASVATSIPLAFGEHRIFSPSSDARVTTTDLARTTAHIWCIGPFFKAMGIPILQGRALNDGDGRDALKVIVVNETLAKRFWPGESALGKRIKWGVEASKSPWMTVVGVAADIKSEALRGAIEPETYTPYMQETDSNLEDNVTNEFRAMKVILRTTGDPIYTAASLRNQVRLLDPSLPVSEVQTMQEVIQDSTRPDRFNTMLLSIFAVTALVLAALGIAGVLAYSVAQRIAEIGLRMALGAAEGSILKLFLLRGMALALAGAGIGLVASLALTRLLGSLLYKTSPYDPWTLIVAPLLLGVVALLATWIPAYRASRVDPIVALRVE